MEQYLATHTTSLCVQSIQASCISNNNSNTLNCIGIKYYLSGMSVNAVPGYIMSISISKPSNWPATKPNTWSHMPSPTHHLS